VSSSLSSPPARIPGRVLVAAAVALAAAGCLLVTLGLSGSPAAPARPSAANAGPASPVTQASTRTGSAPPTGEPTHRTRLTATTTVSANAASPSATASELPPPGSGPAADPIVQRALDQAIPADMPTAIARRLTALGRAVWTAEVTGTGRQRWPHYFTTTPAADALYTRVRIQAAIARQDGSTGRALVHLVWAGADPSGTYLDGRTATVHFTREGVSWNPVR
jgi:hypothetical protein